MTTDKRHQRLDPGGAGRTIVLPAEGNSRGKSFVIENTADAAEDLTVNNDAAGLIGTINQNEAGIFSCDGTTWVVTILSAGSGSDYGASGISADVIAESTSAAGVTIDSLLVKDGEVDLADSKAVIFGTGDDVKLQWDGTWLEGVTIGAQAIWSGAPSKADPSYDTIVHELYDDFIDLHASWTVTEDSAGATQAIGDRNHGSVLLTNAATSDDDACQIQHAQETFQMISGKEIWFEARIKCAAGDATNLDFFVGLAEAEDLTGVADNMPANGFGFHKDDGDTNVDLSTSDGGTDVEQAAVHTLVDATWVRLGLHFDGGASGSGTITPYIDGVAGTAITTAAYATMAEVSPIVMIRNGDGTTTQTIEVDYIKAIQIR